MTWAGAGPRAAARLGWAAPAAVFFVVFGILPIAVVAT